MSRAIRRYVPVENSRPIHVWICPTCSTKRATYEGDTPNGWRESPATYADGPRLECPRCRRSRS